MWVRRALRSPHRPSAARAGSGPGSPSGRSAKLDQGRRLCMPRTCAPGTPSSSGHGGKLVTSTRTSRRCCSPSPREPRPPPRRPGLPDRGSGTPDGAEGRGSRRPTVVARSSSASEIVVATGGADGELTGATGSTGVFESRSVRDVGERPSEDGFEIEVTASGPGVEHDDHDRHHAAPVGAAPEVNRHGLGPGCRSRTPEGGSRPPVPGGGSHRPLGEPEGSGLWAVGTTRRAALAR